MITSLADGMLRAIEFFLDWLAETRSKKTTADQMGFWKTMFAVAGGITLVMAMACGGCLLVGGVGTAAVGTGAAAVNESMRELDRKAAEIRENQPAD